ncbi:ethanolamine ammonia-lyase subunit EutC [Paenibacillus sp. Soil787]|uniref:ethanolamine ammonia-lyase subunit EutC n=1 Tax=Paenibacillus sp. Soil787 TaxID=1736411 RepID=UPI0007034C67|nr:ethanolamine ammonia-lyase subunit EutC [Paenibacillus sp. Soil787]KRF13712.1 ethanolamine ammonia-lyase [Paenibacillus sp. Soil787]
MNEALIETITKIVLEKMNTRQDVSTTALDKQIPEIADGMVRVWDHLQSGAEIRDSFPLIQTSSPFTNSLNEPSEDQGGMVRIWDHRTVAKLTNDKKPLPDLRDDGILPELQTRLGVDEPHYKDELSELIRKTPARIGIGRAGLRPKTEAWLKFRLDHAAAVDAVYGEVSPELLNSLDLFSVETQVSDKEEYIRRPDLGRRLSEEAIQTISKRCVHEPKVQIIVSNGLSSQAIEKNLEDVLLSLQQSLKNLKLACGTPFYIQKGRVAVMDEVGEVLRPEVVVLIIGERPGLLSAESLSAYMCYKPRKGTIEAERMVISNIHSGGIPPVEAGAYLGTVVEKILKYEASGISLVQKEASASDARQN